MCFSTGAAVHLYPWEGLDAREGIRKKSIVKSSDLGIKTTWVLICQLRGLGWPGLDMLPLRASGLSWDLGAKQYLLCRVVVEFMGCCVWARWHWCWPAAEDSTGQLLLLDYSGENA